MRANRYGTQNNEIIIRWWEMKQKFRFGLLRWNDGFRVFHSHSAVDTFPIVNICIIKNQFYETPLKRARGNSEIGRIVVSSQLEINGFNRNWRMCQVQLMAWLLYASRHHRLTEKFKRKSDNDDVCDVILIENTIYFLSPVSGVDFWAPKNGVDLNQWRNQRHETEWTVSSSFPMSLVSSHGTVTSPNGTARSDNGNKNQCL